MTALSDAVVAELAARYSPKQKQNPAWDRKAERATWAAGLEEEYPVPYAVDRTPEEMALDACMAAETASDGGLSLRVLTYAEIAAVVEAVERERFTTSNDREKSQP